MEKEGTVHVVTDARDTPTTEGVKNAFRNRYTGKLIRFSKYDSTDCLPDKHGNTDTVHSYTVVYDPDK